MGISAIFEPENWMLPFHFWSVVMFVLGTMVGSFLNVCIYRMPQGLSIVHPPSHCPHCGYAIPWYLNVPLITWIWLRGRCANCRAPITVRYFMVELLTGVLFLLSWVVMGRESVGVALVYCLVLSGFVVATFIDFEHFIIPDEITIGGIIVGFLCSFAVPAIQDQELAVNALKESAIGMAVGGGVLYAVLRGGKLLFGRKQVSLPPDSRVVFTETSLVLPDEEIPYEDLFYRDSDVIQLEAKRLELSDRCRWSVPVRLQPKKLLIGEEALDPEQVHHMEVLTDKIVLPREAMGFGDVKFMAAIGAFFGWSAVAFSLLVSSLIGGTVGVILILLKQREWSSRIPYGPYIVAAVVIWMFGGDRFMEWWLSGRWALPAGG